MARTRLKRATATALIALAFVAGACSDGRPDPDEWIARWQAALAMVPSQEELGDPPDEAICERALVDLREVSVELSLTPDHTLDAAVGAWIGVVEQAMFECPPEEGEISSLAEAYEEMDQLETEINVLIESRR